MAGALDSRRLRRVLDFVEEHLEDPLSLDQLSARACLSKFHFSRAFRIAVGTSPKRYVSGRRLQLAKSLLQSTRESLANIAFACHFSSQANFSRAFRGATGFTPGRYRQAYQPKPP
jgi:AraC family transcriptional regulator